MDPNVTLENIDMFCADQHTMQEADEYCSYLQEWLNGGGFPPAWHRFPRGEGFFLCWQQMTSIQEAN